MLQRYELFYNAPRTFTLQNGIIILNNAKSRRAAAIISVEPNRRKAFGYAQRRAFSLLTK